MKQVTPSNREHYTRGELENKEGVTMTIYCGVDFHARQQFIMWCDTADGEIHEQQLSHRVPDEVRKFYAQFQGDVIVALEASGYSSWFETKLQQLKHQVWIGHPTEIRRRARSRQKNDRRDAELMLELLLKDEFPRIQRLSPESLEVLRQLRYRHRLVQIRTKSHNALHAIAFGCGTLPQSKAADQ
jgi:transposase